MHTIDRQREQLAMAGIADVPAADLSWVSADLARFKLPDPYVLLVPGGSAGRPAKRWPVAKYGALATELLAHGAVPVLIGGPDEKGLGEEVRAVAPRVRDLIGQTDFTDIAAIARGAGAAIGNDTGPMHLIAAAGCPSVVLFSTESDPRLCAPRGAQVAVLRRDSLKGLGVDEVMRLLFVREGKTPAAGRPRRA
jgi:ADP-heptose:LPS heptosyltransferase